MVGRRERETTRNWPVQLVITVTAKRADVPGNGKFLIQLDTKVSDNSREDEMWELS